MYEKVCNTCEKNEIDAYAYKKSLSFKGKVLKVYQVNSQEREGVTTGHS